jgi:hypothetical protein
MSLERITITALLYGQQMQNVFHLTNTDGFLTREQVAAEVRDHFIGTTSGVGIHQWHTSDTRWIQVTVQTILPTLSVPYNLAISQAGVQLADSQIIPQSCIIMKFQTLTPGRAGRGRLYCLGVKVGFAENGLLNSTFFSFANTALIALRERFLFGGSGPTFLVIAPRTDPGAQKTVTSIEVSTKLGTQRRRNIGYGI